MKNPLLKSSSIVAAFLLATTACAQPSSTQTITKSSNQVAPNISSSESFANTNRKNNVPVSAAIDTRLRQLLMQAGIKTQITTITPSNLPNMYQVNLVGQPSLHITADGKYVIQGEVQQKPGKRQVTKTPIRNSSAQAGDPVSAETRAIMLKNMGVTNIADNHMPFYYTAVPGVIWSASLDGIPFLMSDDAQYITDGEISIIENGDFTGLDEDFEARKNRSVFSGLDESQLIIYPATTTERAIIYVATDVNCPYCRLLHKQMDTLNKKGVTVKAIGYPIYEKSPEQMRAIWCQADDNSRRIALDKAMLTGEMTAAPANCSADYVEPNREKAAGLAVMATPAIYRDDGVMYQASFESPEFLEFLGIQ